MVVDCAVGLARAGVVGGAGRKAGEMAVSRWRLGSGVAIWAFGALIVVAACGSGSSKSGMDPSGGSSGSGASGGKGGTGGYGSNDPNSCTNMKCRPPACCGQACGTGTSCCKGTVCGTSGKCIPDECQACGQVGCEVNFTECTAKCAKPSCCLTACTTDTECCPGTKCLDLSGGGRKCFPSSCSSCGGMMSWCQVVGDCDDTKCVPPPSCGKVCTSDPECETGSVCHQFQSGVKKCVPKAYQAECNACGSKGCLFHGDTCTVDCQTGTGGTGGSAGTGGTAGAAGTAGIGGTGGTGGTSSKDAGPPPPACSPCCSPCGSSYPACCAGSKCGKDDQGNPICIPSSCSYCDNGCTFTCSKNSGV
jgi:hypothetical protein